ncbi:hypothetical protein [Massilia endophytica]|uniref:hypothetical protein n=1 Tax=Massilia endophytica TaxID=2899220 RepID=UPI001E46BDA4|nr:hypothetical protein [Massilia endophytica]UGQ47807.1 hypothetical protein LSQ66_04865 [Massilia endophytica]
MKKILPYALLLLASSAFADEREWVPYKKLVQDLRLDKFYAVPPAQRDKLDLSIKLEPNNKNFKGSDILLTVVHSGGRSPIPVDAQGRIHVVPNPKWVAEDAKIMTSMPTGEKSKMIYVMNAVLPAGTQWPYASLMSSVDQSNEVIGKMAGAFSMFAPKIKSVILKFDKPAQVTIQSKDGAKQYATDAKNQVRLKPDSSLLKENPVMLASARPTEAELDDAE